MTVDNLEYDLLTTLQSKLEALDAYDAYIEDCVDAGNDSLRQMFEEIQSDDERHSIRLRQALARYLASAAEQ